MDAQLLQVTFEEQKEDDNAIGQFHQVSRELHDNGHTLARNLNSEGRVDTMQTLHNLNEDKMSTSECSSVVEVKTLNVCSLLLAANSPFFRRLFKNGMRESHHKEVTLRINESEDGALKELLNFMYKKTVSATTVSDLLGVLTIADKFEVTPCIIYCTALLQEMPMSLESAVLYLGLPSSITESEFVQPLIDAAKKWLVAHFKDINKPEEEAMTLPLVAIEALLGSDCLQSAYSDSRDDVYKFVLKWARAHYPKSEERREILTNRLTQLIPFTYMSCSKLKEVLSCGEFGYERVSKVVFEALFLKVERYELTQPRRFVYFDIKREECKSLSTSNEIKSASFSLGGRLFNLRANRINKEFHNAFGLYLHMVKGSDGCCSLEYEFAVVKKSSKVFENTGEKLKRKSSELIKSGWGTCDLFGIPWTELMSEDSEYFIDGILHIRADVSITNDS